MSNGDKTALLIGALFGVLVVTWVGVPALKEVRK
jgi:hypothetical protein